MGWVVNALVDMGPAFHHLRFAWVTPDPAQLKQLLAIGLVGMGGYILVNRAYQVASASLIAPFDYSYLPIGTLVAWLIWAEVPGARTVLGMGLIVGAGLYLGWRELRAARRRDAPAPVAETVFVPAAPVVAEEGARHPDHRR